VILSVDLATCQSTLLVSVFWLQTDQPICANVNSWQNFLTHGKIFLLSVALTQAIAGIRARAMRLLAIFSKLK